MVALALLLGAGIGVIELLLILGIILGATAFLGVIVFIAVKLAQQSKR